MNNNFLDYAIYLPSSGNFTFESCTGGNRKSVLVVYKKESKAESEANLGLLEKILKAIQLDITEDISLLELPDKATTSFKPIFQADLYKTIIIFEFDPGSFGLHFTIPFYQAVHHQGIKILRSHGLTEIGSNKNNKALLWNCLKENFLL